MTQIVYPPPDARPWPTLGPAVCQFIEENLVHGPGDLLGEPVELDDEQKAWIYRLYEVEPLYLFTKAGRRYKRKNPRAGRRRFERCVLSLRKGSSKTEFAAWIAICEAHPEGPVRCDGFEKDGTPIPCPVRDPYIPMISFTEEQTEELAYGAVRRILEECDLGRDFDIGLERVLRLDGHGKIEAVSASPNARDGARTTFEHADETHRFVLQHHRDAWKVMLANLAKRPIAEPWALETTTAPEPGVGSVAESTMSYAQHLMENGNGRRARFFFFHREAGQHRIDTDRGLRAAIKEASGPYVSKWSDIDRIVSRFRDSDADLAYLERVWLNRPVQAATKAFDVETWSALIRPGYQIPDGAQIVLGFDGSRFDDATALVATSIEDKPHQVLLGIWQRPREQESWEVSVEEVDGAVSDAFERWAVARMYCDPPKWETKVSEWAGRYGEKVVVEWWTNRRKPMAYAIRAYVGAIASREFTHDGNQVFRQHIGNAQRLYTNLVDEEGQALWILRKERPDSPAKIDGAMAAVLSWEAYRDAVAAGVEPELGWVLI